MSLDEHGMLTNPHDRQSNDDSYGDKKETGFSDMTKNDFQKISVRSWI